MKQLTITKQISNPSNKHTFNMYLLEVSKYDPLSAEEEVELVKKLKENDSAAREKLCLHNLRFVVSVAKQYQYMVANSCISLEDLIMEGNVGLVKAADKFDETRGFKFISYAVWWIRQGILECIMNNLKAIRVPTNKVMLHNKLAEIERRLEQLHERPADIVEIYDAAIEQNVLSIYSNADMDSACYQQSTMRMASLNAPLKYGNSRDEVNLLDVIENEDSIQPDEKLIDKNYCKIIADHLNKMDMPRNIRETYTDYFGLNGDPPMSLADIARKQDVSTEAVRVRIKNWNRHIRIYDRKNGDLLKSIFNEI